MSATLAQLVEQLIRNQQVVGSNPTGGSRKPPIDAKFWHAAAVDAVAALDQSRGIVGGRTGLVPLRGAY